MRPFAVALGLTLCLAVPALAETPPSEQPGAEPGKAEGPTEGLPTQGTPNVVVPVPGHVTVRFPHGSAKLPNNQHEAVARLANPCRAGQGGKIVLVGYPDGAGDSRRGIKLGLLRAEAVMDAVLADGKHRRFAWQVAAEDTPDQHNGEASTVIGRCR